MSSSASSPAAAAAPAVVSSLLLPPLFNRLSCFTLYETQLRYYMVGSSVLQPHLYRILKIDRMSVHNLNIDADSQYYDLEQLNSILQMTSAVKITQCYGLLGFTKFLSGYYMFVATACQQVANIGKHVIYSVTDTQLIYIPHPSLETHSPHSKLEAKYRSLFCVLDCTKTFYFSYTYPLTQTLQFNMLHSTDYSADPAALKQHERSIYVWNSHLLEGLQSALPAACRDWAVSIIHGYIEQCNFSVFGRVFSLTLISRRSRLFAGTRYLKRGVNETGCTANEVETEQIVADKSAETTNSGNYTSHVQMRGSIPVHWAQEGNVVIAQPAIVLQKVDPLHLSTRAHVANLFERYGAPLLMLNLVKQTERRQREVIVGAAFSEAIQFINSWLPQQLQVEYLAWDFKKISKSKTHSVVDELAVIAHWSVQKTGLFHSQPTLAAAAEAESQQQVPVQPTRESLKQFVDNLPERKPGVAEKARAQFTAASAITMQHIHEAAARPQSPAIASSSSAAGAVSPGMEIFYNQQQQNTPAEEQQFFSISSLMQPPESPVAAGHSLTAAIEPNVMTQAKYKQSADNDYKALLQLQDNNNNNNKAKTSTTSTPGRRSSVGHTHNNSLSSSEPAEEVKTVMRELAFIQRGICRSNCIDSLDRTNVAAFCIGRCSLGYQLHAMGLIDSQQTEANSEIVNILLAMYERMGDVLALQYGGSQMHRQMKKDREKTVSLAPVLFTKQSAPTKPKEMFVSLMRHYQNSFQDTGKQDSMNLFLGLFKPDGEVNQPLHTDIWDMVSDYYLHNTELCGPAAEHNLNSSSYLNEEWFQLPLKKFESNLMQFARHRNFSRNSISGDNSLLQMQLPAPTAITATTAAAAAVVVVAAGVNDDDKDDNEPVDDVDCTKDLLFYSVYGDCSQLSSFDSMLEEPLSKQRPVQLAGLLKEEKKTSAFDRLRAGLRFKRMNSDLKADDEFSDDELKWMMAEDYGAVKLLKQNSSVEIENKLALPEKSISQGRTTADYKLESFYEHSLEHSLNNCLINEQAVAAAEQRLAGVYNNCEQLKQQRLTAELEHDKAQQEIAAIQSALLAAEAHAAMQNQQLFHQQTGSNEYFNENMLLDIQENEHLLEQIQQTIKPREVLSAPVALPPVAPPVCDYNACFASEAHSSAKLPQLFQSYHEYQLSTRFNDELLADNFQSSRFEHTTASVHLTHNDAIYSDYVNLTGLTV